MEWLQVLVCVFVCIQSYSTPINELLLISVQQAMILKAINKKLAVLQCIHKNRMYLLMDFKFSSSRLTVCFLSVEKQQPPSSGYNGEMFFPSEMNEVLKSNMFNLTAVSSRART